MRKILALPLFLIVACATPMHTQVLREIHVGDPLSKVQEMLGDPTAFNDSPVVPGAKLWYYTNHGSKCAFLVKDEKVINLSCDGSGYVGVGQRMARGYAAGVANASRNSMNCTSTVNGNIVNTNCN